MTVNPGNLERKVRQLDNDVQAIYEQLATISTQVISISAQLATISTQVISISAQLKRHDNRFDALEARFDARFDDVDAKFAELKELIESRL